MAWPLDDLKGQLGEEQAARQLAVAVVGSLLGQEQTKRRNAEMRAQELELAVERLASFAARVPQEVSLP